LKKFFENCDDLTISFPYIFPVLIDRLNAVNIEGNEHIVDEQMKPTPSQKPLMMIKPPEPSEEIRLLIAELVTVMIK
jgi:hypothetical protein